MDDPRPLAEIYLKLREQALGFGPAEIKAGPVVPGGRVLGVVMDLGYDAGAASVVGLADGTTSLYVSSGGAVIGAGEDPDAAAASKHWVAVAEKGLGALAGIGRDGLPADGRIRFNVLTGGPPLVAEAAEAELAAGAHALSELYAAGQDVITELRRVDEARRAS